jgi:endonuclease/exonuclease/phosphatase family metal-dependent hydrolase
VLERIENREHPTPTHEGPRDVPLLDPTQLGNNRIQVLNCYLQPGEQQNLKERAKRVTDIVRDIIRQDPNAPIIVCGDLNNHMDYVVEQLRPLNFSAALEPGTETHRQGGHLDQVFARNMTIGEVTMSPGYSDEISDHRCLKVSLRPL